MAGVKGKSGRPPESKLRRFHELIDNCWSQEARQEVLMELVNDCRSKVFQERHESRKLLFAYTFGKPTEHVQHEVLDPKKVARDLLSELQEKYRLPLEQAMTIVTDTCGDILDHGQIG